MMTRWIAAAVLGLAFTGPALAADLEPGVAAVVVVEPTPLEWLRYVRPREGRDIVTVMDGVTVRTIEWRHPVEVRVRTESGETLTDRERAAIRALALVCDRGVVQHVAERTERNGTFVLNYDCVWLQGFEARPPLFASQ